MVFDHDYENFPELSNAELSDFGFSSPHVQIVDDFDAVVVKVHDGDTVTLSTDFRDFEFPLRFLNIDAPELNEGGEVARDWLISQVEGRAVRVLIDQKQRVGKYGRLLGRVFHNGLDVGESELHLGLARPFSARNDGVIPDVGQLVNTRWLST